MTVVPDSATRETVELRRGRFACLVSPRCGGSIANLRMDGPDGILDLLRPASESAIAGTFAPDLGCFPLVPFSNRIAGARFTFRGREIVLPTDPGSPHCIHGHGWSSHWQAERLSEHAVRLHYRHEPDSWPWAYEAVQTIALTGSGLAVALELVNLSDEVMPAGIGLHPYFPKPPDTIVATRVETMWESDETILPRTRRALPAHLRFADGLAMDGIVLDNGFTGWDGFARISWPSLGYRLELRAEGPFGHLIVYAPRDEGYLCLEPVSHMTDAVNRPEVADNGLVALEPGGRLAGRMELSVEPL